MNKNNSNEQSSDLNKSSSLSSNLSGGQSVEKKYTLQGLISKIKQSEPSTIGNTFVDLSELIPNPYDSSK